MGDKNSSLTTLLAKNVKRSKIGKIRERFHEIEEAQRNGVMNIDIVNALNSEGHELTLKTFENMLYRIRKENNNDAKHIQNEKTKTKEPQKENKSVNTQYDESLLPAFIRACFGSERIAKRAIEAGVSIEEIKSWKCPNQINLGTRLTNYIQTK
ncbi:hypothetical protein HVY71_26120 (plasmid) [Citrobacter freundii]|nr:hypothetical protein HVY71_26120 [Citrobacter freundii]